jgi:hypothetical protein
MHAEPAAPENPVRAKNISPGRRDFRAPGL